VSVVVAHCRRQLKPGLVVLIAALFLVRASESRSVQAPALPLRDQTLAPVHDNSPIILPATGLIDDRRFFSSMRHPAIEYPDRQTNDAVAELARQLDAGAVRLRFEKDGGFLRSVLEALSVPVESQSVVFSKTSLQSHYISPANPRALFFTDEVSVGFVRGAPLLEISALDAQQGVIFYAIDQRQAEKPEILRHDSCLSCHQARVTLEVPGLILRSVGTGAGGEALVEFGNFNSDHRSPFQQRWGGWFITGRTGFTRHMGNTLLPGSTETLSSLEGKFEMAGYPSPYSDVSAVLVLNHQVRMTNLLTRVGWETRIALDQIRKNPRDKAAAERLIEADARELADYILFADEAPFPGKFEPSTNFPARFAASAPKDRRGRSLKQLDLEKRLLRYPCSYMIYSRAFDGLPGAVKDKIYARMWAVLSGADKASKYSKLSQQDRAAIVSILLETKPGLPDYFRSLER
jgi:hypothetical protein